MKKVLLLLLWIPFLSATAQVEFNAPSEESFGTSMRALPPHPRLLLLPQQEALLRVQIIQDPFRKNIHKAILAECEQILGLPPVQRIQIGRRLLDKSRECLRRVFQLSYAFRLTSDPRFLKRAEQEMLVVSGFSDWNPSHFLDVAEMTLAVAIGYDWLYHHLSENSRKIIRTAIVEKGIKLSYNSQYNHFLNQEHNWNQVCNAGMTFGALAVAENEMELATKTIHRAIATTPKSMYPYGPDGAYPEGYGYWGYGTSFNVLLISALESALGSDFGLSKIPGFLNTGHFLQHMVGPLNMVHNWGDSGLNAGLNPAMFWFAEKTKDESILWNQRQFVDGSLPIGVSNRLLPTALIWGLGINLNTIQAPKTLLWTGQGPSPVSLMRTSWSDPQPIFVGFKTGSAKVNHAHMDAGSFVLDALGERWAMDFGMQDYHSLETKGIKVFGRDQNAQRWEIFRYTNLVHNTLTIDGQLQRVDGYAAIDGTSSRPDFLATLSDLTSIYNGQAQSVKRGVAIRNKKEVLIQDEILAPEKDIVIRWTMLTPAEVKITGKNTVELSQKGKKMQVTFDASSPIVLKTWTTEPPNDYDAPNPGTSLFGLETTIPAGKSGTIKAVISPQKVNSIHSEPLAKWPLESRK